MIMTPFGASLGQENIVNPFDGSVSYSVSLTSGVTITYSSSTVPTIMSAENRDIQASWVGAGWTLETGAIEADSKGTTAVSDDEWTFVDAGGTRTKILKDHSGNLRLQNNPSWKIVLETQEAPGGYPYTDSLVTGITVFKDDGTKLKYGDFQTGIGTKKANRCILYWGDRVTDYLVNVTAGNIGYRWDLSQIIDPYGIIIADYYYEQEQESPSGISRSYTRASYLDRIINRRSGQKITFTRSDRNSNEYPGTPSSVYKIARFEKKYLSSVGLYPSESSSQLIQAWDLAYQLIGSGTKTKRLLQSVTQKDPNNRTLPPQKFSYDSSNQYILQTVRHSSGGTTQITTQAYQDYWRDQSTEASATILAGYATPGGYQIAASGNTIVRYALYTPSPPCPTPPPVFALEIRKWTGRWKNTTYTVSPTPKPGSPVTLKATDDHILLQYTYTTPVAYPPYCKDSVKLIILDWRDDSQDWQLGFSLAPGAVNAAKEYDKMISGISESGSHVVLLAGKTGDLSTLKVRTWDPLRRIWDNPPDSLEVDGFPSLIWEVSDDLVFFDNSSSTFLVQWAKLVGSFGFDGPLQVTSSVQNEVYTLKKGYIGRWNTSNGSLYAYHFVYNSTDLYQRISAQSLGTYGSSAKKLAVFTDERILVSTVSGSSANVYTWKRDGANFVQASTFPVVQSIDSWTNGIWDLQGQINNDWVFLFKHRIGSTSQSYEGKMWSFSWNGSAYAQDTIKTYANYSSCVIPIYNAELSLNENYVVVEASSNSGTDCDSATFTDVYELDRTRTTSWPLNRDRIMSRVNDTWFIPPAQKHVPILGPRFVGTHDPHTGSVKVKFFHDVDKNWGNYITSYRVSQVAGSDSMGNSYLETYAYDSAPSFDASLSTPGYRWMKRILSGSGFTRITHDTTLSQPRLRGIVELIESYKQDGTTLIQKWDPSWSIYQDPNKWYLYQIRKTSEVKTLDGVSDTTLYEYNNTNGLVSKITQLLDVTSDQGDLRDKIVEVKFALEQYPVMQSTNMLSQIYETSTSAVRSAVPPTMMQASVPPQPFEWDMEYSDVKQFTPGFDQLVHYEAIKGGGGHARIGTTPGGSQILNCLASSCIDSFIALKGTTYYLSTYIYTSEAFPNAVNSVSIQYDASGGPMSALVSKQQTEYNSNRRPYRSKMWNGSGWDIVSTVIDTDAIGNPIEIEDISGLRTSTKWGWNNTLPVAQFRNARKAEVGFVDFEDGTKGEWNNTGSGGSSTSVSHTGTKGWVLSGSNSYIARTFPISALTAPSKKYTFSGWVKTTSIRGNLYWDITYGGGAHAYIQSTPSVGTNKWEFLSSTVDLNSYSNVTQVTVYVRNYDNTYYAYCTWDDIRFYPSDAFVSSTTYDPNTFKVLGITDENNVTSYSTYDPLGRSTQSFNDDRKVISQQSIYYSREKNNATFNSSDPNFSTTITYTSSTGHSDFYTSAGWAWDGDVTFNYDKTGETTVKLGYIPQYCYSCGEEELTTPPSGEESGVLSGLDSLIEGDPFPGEGSAESGGGGVCCDPAIHGTVSKGAGSGNVIARVDFFPDNTTGGTPKIAFDGSNYRFGVYYSVSQGKFDVAVTINGTPSASPYRFLLNAPLNKWYTIELEKTSAGKCYVWVFPKGESRNYADMYSAQIYPGDWAPLFWCESSGGDVFLANSYVGSFSQTTTYLDGLGRTLQSQVRDGLNDLVSAVQYDSLGRQHRNWRTFSYNTGHLYDGSFASHATTIFGVSNPFVETLFKDDPLSRASAQKGVATSVADEEIRSDFGSATLNDGLLYRYNQAKQKPSKLAGTVWVVTRQSVDKLGRVVESSLYGETGGGDVLTTKTSYTFLNQVYKTIRPKGDSAVSQYDFLGRTKQIMTPDEGTSKYIYDKGGRLRFMIDAEGSSQLPNKILYWKYDLVGRVTEKGYITSELWGTGSTLQGYANSDPSYPATPATWRKKYLYDSNGSSSTNYIGRLYSVLTNNDDDNTAEVEEYFTYDKFGNATTVSQKTIDFDDTLRVSTYAYDLLGRNTRITYPASSNGTVEVNYTFDQAGRVSSIAPTTGSAFAKYFFSNQGGVIDSETVNLGGPSIKGRKFSYDTKGRLVSIASGLFTETIRYDSNGYYNNEGFYHGLIASTISNYGGSPSTLTYKFQYDKFGRLVASDNSYDSLDVGIGSGASTAYDLNGNVARMKRAARPIQDYTYWPGKNRVQNTDGSGGDYTYDLTGNTRTSPLVPQYIRYDAFTMLTMCEKKTTTDSVNFEYGGAKQRVYKKNTTGATSTSTLYIHGGNDYPLVEKTSGGVERTYVYGPTGLIAMRVGTTWYYILKDHLNSTRVVFNTSGTVQSTYDYDSYGSLRRSTINTDIAYRFTGQEFDSEVGIHNFRARMYDSELGMFYATDPAREGTSPYGYVSNNPVSLVDPTGRRTAWLNTDPLGAMSEYLSAKPLGNPLIGWQDSPFMQIFAFGASDVWALNGGFHSFESWSENMVAQGISNNISQSLEQKVRYKILPALQPEEVCWLRAAMAGEATDVGGPASKGGLNENSLSEMAQIAYVILNRLALGGFGKNLIDVITSPFQINGINAPAGKYIVGGLTGTKKFDVRSDATWEAYAGIYSGEIPNLIGSARYFGSTDQDLGTSNTRIFRESRRHFESAYIFGAFPPTYHHFIINNVIFFDDDNWR